MRWGSATRRAATKATAPLVLAATVAVAVLGGCTSARNDLGTNAGPCFRALPAAASAVHGRGHFGGVLLVKASSLDTDRERHIRDELSARAGHQVSTVCLVEYVGSFTQRQVRKPIGKAPPRGTGRYAIAVVDMPDASLLATFVTDRQPMRFRHNRVGG